jgi:hypothetical protein
MNSPNANVPNIAENPEGFANHLANGLNNAIARMQNEWRADLSALREQMAPGNKRGPKPPNPDYYDGRVDAVVLHQWMNQMEDYIGYFQYSPASTEPVQLASFYLSMHARTWWSQLDHNLKRNMTWEQFKAQLKARFFPIDHERQVISRLERLTQRGPVSKYIEAFESLRMQLSGISDITIQRYFINGLRNDLKVKAVEFLLDHPSSHLSELYQRVTAIGEVIWETRIIQRDPHAMDLSPIFKMSNRTERTKIKTKNVKRDKSNITCYKCQRKGHYRNECPSKGINVIAAVGTDEEVFDGDR